jgi:hypothetical protein
MHVTPRDLDHVATFLAQPGLMMGRFVGLAVAAVAAVALLVAATPLDDYVRGARVRGVLAQRD